MWARSVANNPDIDFYIVTDLPNPKVYSKNIKFVTATLESIQNQFSEILKFPVTIVSPHKICDYKPFYGLLLNEALVKYKYWGYCDIDLIFGDLGPLLDIVNEGFFDIVSPWDFTVGHCTIIRNTEKCNSIALKTANLELRLREPDTTFIDEGAFCETALKIGGFKFLLSENVNDEYKKERSFLGVTVGPAGKISRILTDYCLFFRNRKIFVAFDGDKKEHEVLYFHFMSVKKRKYWSNYKGGCFDGCLFSRIGWLDKNNSDPRSRFLYGYKAFIFNFPDFLYAKVRRYVPGAFVSFLKNIKIKIFKK